MIGWLFQWFHLPLAPYKTLWWRHHLGQGRPGELWQKLQWLYWRLELCDRRLRIVKSLVQESSPTSNNYLSSPFPKSNLYEWLILWCLGLFMSNTNGSWLNLTTGWDKVNILVLQCLQLLLILVGSGFNYRLPLPPPCNFSISFSWLDITVFQVAGGHPCKVCQVDGYFRLFQGGYSVITTNNVHISWKL